MICFEVPSTEQVRISLRLEQLYNETQFFLANPDKWHSKACVETILDMLQLLDRPEIRNKFVQEVARIKSNLQRIQANPQLDQDKLSDVLTRLNEVSGKLHANNGKFAESLRQNEFVKRLGLQHSIPGGISEYHLPEYQYWLQSSFEKRKEQCQTWLKAFDEILFVTSLLLQLAREGLQSRPVVAKEGFFQSPLDPQLSCQLIRVEINEDVNVFPMVSFSHGVSIRFQECQWGDKPLQTRRDIPFVFSCCAF